MENQYKQGQFLQQDYFNNTGGLNLTDSPFVINEGQAVEAQNVDLIATGGFKKRFGHTAINSGSPNGVPIATGCFLQTDLLNTKTLLRATSSVLQTVNQSTGATTLLTDDTSLAGSTPFSTTQPACFVQFNTSTNIVTWIAGSGQSGRKIIGYNGTKYTENGAAPATGALTSSSTSGTQNLATGTYYYAVTLTKSATGSESNAALDLAVSVTTGSSHVVVISLTSLTSLDTTKYSTINLYRSAISGSSGFTAGDLVASVASTATSINDDGTVAAVAALNIPRAGNVILDQSTLPQSAVNVPYNCITSWKRRLVVAAGSTVYFSDVNKPESWPTSNTIMVPSGGPITAIGSIQFNTPTSANVDEILVIFKQREMWMITGKYFVTLTSGSGSSQTVYQTSDIQLMNVDSTGCTAQNSIVQANGYMFWIEQRGFFMWDGANKPIYISRLIDFDFNIDGDIDKANLNFACGTFVRRLNQIVWVVSSSVYGTQKRVYKLDLRLTLQQSSVPASLVGRILDGVFIRDILTNPLMGLYCDILSTIETIYAVGNDGYIWSLFNTNNDNGTAVDMVYTTGPLFMERPNTVKRYYKVIVWCQENTLSNLNLYFWTNLKTLTANQSQSSQQISQEATISYWDQAYWDATYKWDSYVKTYTPVVFNLSSSINTEGEALTLKFEQNTTGTPCTIAGFSVIYSVVGQRL